MDNDLVITAAQSASIFQAACLYAQSGLSVLPLQGKRPALNTWRSYQYCVASSTQLNLWQAQALFTNVGIVCGTVSGNLAVLDLDGLAAYDLFCQRFPTLAQTYTVTTGSQAGVHLYWRVANLPPTLRILATPYGNLELCTLGRQVVAPPSRHPDTGKFYSIREAYPIQQVTHLEGVVQWLKSHRTAPPVRAPTRYLAEGLNPQLVDAITQRLLTLDYRLHGDWLNGRCLFPQHHRHADAHPSFGFNRRSGYGHCFVCGTLLAKDLCVALGMDTGSLGGLWNT
jgi:hypothetical protein